ncbi:MAG: ABC transporter permease [Candidatus Aminicenantes bacterium]|nr:MAG: ABC transporter permease [Candidatus Aminicenantes bacterium]
MNNQKKFSMKHRILSRLLRPSIHESAFQDFDEQFIQLKRSRGAFITTLWFGVQVLSLIPSLIKDSLTWSTTMLRNYLKITLRNIRRHKGYSFINIAGLAIGMACAILILLWIQDELSFDRFHENGENIYRIIVEDVQGLQSAGTCPIPLGPHSKQTYPEILDSTRFCNGFQKFLIEFDGRVFSEEIGIVDPSFLWMFTFPFLKGDPQTALEDPYSLIMTEKMARKYFGAEDPIGKVIRILSSRKQTISFTVTGILEDIPRHSHLQFQIYLPFQALDEMVWWVRDFEKWSDWSYFTYILTKPGITIPELNRKITDLVRQNDEGDDLTSKFFLQPLAKIHLHSHYKYDLAGHGDIRSIYIFAIVAAFILLIACANFMNLSTARFSNRSREVGLRKTIGAHRTQLIKQFLGESLFFVLIALFVAFILIKLSLQLFNQLTGKPLELNMADLSFLLSLAAVIFFTGLIAGSYPALFLSAFQPADVLKGTSRAFSKGAFFRKFLVVLQFSLSIIIIICTTIVYNQLTFMRNKKLGFDKDNVIHLPLSGTIHTNYDVIRNELLSNPHISAIAASDQLLTQIFRASTGARAEGKDVCEHTSINFLTVDFHFLDTLDMKLSQGRLFSEEFPTDADEAVIINRTLAKILGGENMLGKKLYNYSEGRTRRIVGIVDDFHFESLHSQVKPLMIVPKSSSDYKFMYVKIRPGRISSSLKFLRDTWKKYGSANPFEYNFLDQTVDQLYASEKRMGKIFLNFAFLAIFISCLGLLGLASFTAEQRTKEIGIRRVLGASSVNITYALTSDFSKWILAANVIAWPVAYFTMHKWLQNFAFKTDMNLWVFLLSGTLSLAIALITVGYQSAKAALANPADSLRYE